MKRALVCLYLLAAALFAAPLSERGTPDYSRGIVDRAKAIAAAAEVTSEKYPNAEDVLVDDHIIERYWADGSAITWDDTYAKVLTEKGRKDWQSLQFWLQRGVNTVSVPLVEVIKPDGTVVPVDVARNSREMADPGQMQSNIYDPNRRILVVGVPGLELGDVVHYVSRREVTNPRVPKTWSEYQILEYTSPMRRYVYEVIAPVELPLAHRVVKDPVEGTVAFKEAREKIAEAGDQVDVVRYRWGVTDVPRMYREPQMPPLPNVVQRLLLSTIEDWRDVSRWYWELSSPALAATSPEMEAKVKELIAGKDDPMAKVKAIFHWVSQNVRYAGVTPDSEAEAPGYQPHLCKDTFERRHGVCRDKAALLVAMLRLAGLDAYPVLIHNGPKKDPEVPQPFFNHAISAVQLEAGSYVLMDSTDENTRRLLPAYLGNQSYLVARPEGETLLTSPVSPATANLMEIKTTGQLDAEGNLTAASDLLFHGFNDTVYRPYFRRWKPAEIRRYFEGAVKSAAAGATLESMTMEPQDLGNTDVPLVVKLKFSAPNVLVRTPRLAMLSPPFLGLRVGIANFVIGGAGLEQRRYPFTTDPPCGVRESLSLTLGDGVGDTVSLPEYSPVETAGITWTRRLERRGDTLRGDNEFLIKVPEMPPAEYQQLRDALKTIEYNGRKMPLFANRETLVPGMSEADRVILADDTEYALTDRHNWTETRRVRMQLLTYAARKDFAELHFDFNPAWEDLEVESAQVTLPDGKILEVRKEEANLMDADWVGQAPRYPAGKTMVVLLPGVEEGAVADYVVRRTVRDRPFFAARHVFRDFDPVHQRTVRIVAPADLELQIRPDPTGTVRLERRADGDRVVYEWSASDQPAIKREDGLPPTWTFAPVIMVSTGSWEDYADRLGKALHAATDDQDLTRQRARELVADIAAPTARIHAVRDFVAKTIRRAGPDLQDIPLSAITPADQTLADGYGNSADRAVVLYTMLRAIGRRPDFVGATYLPNIPALADPARDCPDPGFVHAVLVRLEEDKQILYLNDGDQYSALAATTFDGDLGLPLRSGLFRTPRLVPIEAPAAYQDRTVVDFAVDLAADGSAVLTRTRTFRGPDYGDMKRRIEEMAPEERRRYFQEAVAGISQAAEPIGDLETIFDTYPGIETVKVRVPTFAVRDGQYLYFRLPATLARFLYLRSDSRTNPLLWQDARRTRIVTRVNLPADFIPVLPAPGPTVAWRAPAAAGSIRVNATVNDGQLDIVQDGELLPGIIPAGDYPSLLDVQRRLAHPSTSTVVLQHREAAK